MLITYKICLAGSLPCLNLVYYEYSSGSDPIGDGDSMYLT